MKIKKPKCNYSLSVMVLPNRKVICCYETKKHKMQQQKAFSAVENKLKEEMQE